ncbi:MAG: hypothetical protein B6245_11290 [Desulfobacteraceae bacterium 4572_88]|nr:MAG: hypothetical protein B6245_11290 [Desulfobacteraceae bacterium 4572_88]
MKRKSLLIAVSFLSHIFLIPAYAQVVLDGTMGTAGPVNGPKYEISTEYGQQAGANLFHSFSQFDINTGETANFGVSSATQNIISRVTGGGSSWIDGTLQSTISGTSEISGANLYLLNPAGVMFGPNAALDIGGSFHVTTADYLRMGESEQFYAAQENKLLSASPPSAFGFLDNEVSPVSFEGNGKIGKEEWDGNPMGLSVSDGNTISVIGGDISISGTFYLSGEENIPLGNLSAPGGEIRMASVAATGEVIPRQDDLDLSEFSTLGTITLSKHALLDTSGEGSGNMFIRAGQFFAENSAIQADTKGDQDGGLTDIRADTLSLVRSDIYSDAKGHGTGGNIHLRADEFVSISDFSRVFADTTGEEGESGDAGNVRIETRSLSLSDGSIVSSDTFDGGGNGGNITITGPDDSLAQSIDVSASAKIYSGAIQGQFPGADQGNGGSVNLEAENITFTNGSIIASESTGTGNGGNVRIYASESLRLSGKDHAGNPSKAYTATFSKTEGAGNAGSISIDAGEIVFEDEGGITASTRGPGHAGTIDVQTTRLHLDTGASISSESTSEDQGGDAGLIRIRAEDSVTLFNGSTITTEAINAGKGQIIIEVGDKLYLKDGKITTSIRAGAEDAGNITVDQDFAILNKGQIIANAWAGRGGNIRITGDRLIQSSDSRVEASSALGIDGSVHIEAPDKDLSGDLTVLPNNFIDVTRWMQKACAVRSEEDVSRFLLLGRDAIPTPLNDLMPSPPLEEKD